MARLRFLADEHVPQVFVRTLRSRGFTVETVQGRLGQGTVDSQILDAAADSGRVVITNDHDFLRYADERNHAGVLCYTDRNVPQRDPTAAAAEAVARIDGQYDKKSIRNTVEWLDGWL